jgi:RNA polymerase sigma factor (sigma-70 family)
VKEAAVHRTIDGIWRIESAKMIAALARMVRDVGLAEDLAQDALLAALERWPETGIPDNPGAWLMTTAKRRAIDHMRRNKLRDRKYEELGWEIDRQHEPDWDEALDDSVGDDLLRLIFTTCHPILSAEARVALTLRLLGGLTTEEIASAFLVPEPTVAQRIVRAKRTLAATNVPFLSNCRRRTNWPRGCRPCWRLSTSCSMRVMPPLPVEAGFGLCFAARRFGLDGY